MDYKTFIIKPTDSCVAKGKNGEPASIMIKDDVGVKILVPLFAFDKDGKVISPSEEAETKLHFEPHFIDPYLDSLNKAADEKQKFGYILRCEPRVGLVRHERELSLVEVPERLKTAE